MIPDRSLRLALAAITLVAVALFALDVSGAARTAVLVVFVLLCPGLAWSRRFATGDALDSLALAAGFGICSVVVVGQVMALAKWWSPGTGFAVLVAITALGLALPAKEPEPDGERV